MTPVACGSPELALPPAGADTKVAAVCCFTMAVPARRPPLHAYVYTGAETGHLYLQGSEKPSFSPSGSGVRYTFPFLPHRFPPVPSHPSLPALPEPRLRMGVRSPQA